MTIVGITGRSGSGKSALTAYIASKGYATIDCDKLAHKAIEKGSPCLDELASAFGNDIINNDGSLNRALLSQKSFINKEKQQLLNSITHPYITRMVFNEIKNAQINGEKIVFIDVPLLIDYPLEQYCDKIVVVTSDENIQITRLLERGMTSDQAIKRLATQTANKRLIAAGDYIISNTANLDELHIKANNLLKKINHSIKRSKKKGLSKRRIPFKSRRLLPLFLLILLIPIVGLTIGVLNSLEHEIYSLEYERYVETASKNYGVDSYLIFAVIKTESGFNPDAISNVGARGLMQITEETFDWIQLQIDPGGEYNYDDMYEPDVNIEFGSYYISRCLERYDNDISTAVAAYHSGWGTVDGLLENPEYSDDGKTLKVFPYEQMNHYVDKINANYKSYLSIYNS